MRAWQAHATVAMPVTDMGDDTIWTWSTRFAGNHRNRISINMKSTSNRLMHNTAVRVWVSILICRWGCTICNIAGILYRQKYLPKGFRTFLQRTLTVHLLSEVTCVLQIILFTETWPHSFPVKLKFQKWNTYKQLYKKIYCKMCRKV